MKKSVYAIQPEEDVVREGAKDKKDKCDKCSKSKPCSKCSKKDGGCGKLNKDAIVKYLAMK